VWFRVHLSWTRPQHTTSLSHPSLGFVTITHPHHPLHGQRCEVVHIRRGVDPDLVIRLPDGSHAAVALSWTSEGGAPAEALATHPLPLLDLTGLRQAVRLLEHLRRQGRFPRPRRAPRASSPSRSR
jgi:Family of unknown function (DUF5372)